MLDLRREKKEMPWKAYNFLCPLWFGGETKIRDKIFNFKFCMFEMSRNNSSKHLCSNHYKM